MSQKVVFLGYPFSIAPIRDAVLAALMGYAELKCADMELTDLQLLDKIEKMMSAADLCLFDVSTHNVNVAVEFGAARGLGLSPILLYCTDKGYQKAESESDVFSDLRGIDSLRYKTFQELETELRRRLPALLEKTRKRLRSRMPRLQARLREETGEDRSHWLVGDVFNSGDGPANRIKVALAGYMLRPTVPTPQPNRIGTMVQGESPRQLAFRLEAYGMVDYLVGMEHVLVEFCDDSGDRYEQRGRLIATVRDDGSHCFSFEGLGPIKAIERFSLPTLGLENP